MPLQKKDCSHAVGIVHDLKLDKNILIDIDEWDLMDEKDFMSTKFNYCPWCGVKINSYIEDGCLKGGCAD